VNVDPDAAPGRSSPTYEALLDASTLNAWIDTVYPGFASAATAGYIQIEDGTPDVTSRGLFRFDVIQDSVFVPGGSTGIVGFDSARVVFALDSARTVLAGGGTTAQLVSVEQEWDISANWELAVDSPGVSIPWTAGPGGSLGVVMSEVLVSEIVTDTTTEFPDSIVFELGEASDSLLSLWNDTTQVNTGLAIVVADSGRLVAFRPKVVYVVYPEVQPDTTVTLQEFATAGTFIFDQTAVTNVEGILRVGGVDGWRSFIELDVPDSVPVVGSTELAPLRGSSVNKAELVLTSFDPPTPPFGAETDFLTAVSELADDFGIYGPKTPIAGPVVGSEGIVKPDFLEADSIVSIDLTLLFQAWAKIPVDSLVPPVRIQYRAAPDGQTFGFWEFGAIDGDPAYAPFLRIVFTPPVGFTIP
jgi:hypothetical protein